MVVCQFRRWLLTLKISVVFFPCLMANPCFSENIGVVRGDERVMIRSDQQILCRYKYGGVPWKPYVEELYTPTGVNILRDAPSDHLHHHGLMFAIKVDGVNFWEEATSPGLQKTEDTWDVQSSQNSLRSHGGFTTRITWINSADSSVLLKEERTLWLAVNPEPKATVLGWKSRFTLPEGKDTAELTGTNYHGLGMRFPVSMDKDGAFLNSDGQTGVEGTNDKKSPWCAYSALADNRPVTVAMFDHKDNPRFPATWFTMTQPFAYLSATLNLSREPLAVKKGEDLVLRYLLVLMDGQMNADAIRTIGTKWLDQPFEIK